MMRRGMVIKLNNNYAIIATDDSDFIKIEIKEGMNVGQKIFFFDEDIISLNKDNKKRSAMPNYIKAVAVLAACIVVAVMINNPFVRDVHLLYAMVSLDINPSFELGVDEAFNVVQVNAMNEESKEILDKKLIGKPLKIAVSKILSDVEASGYALELDNALLVSTVNFKNDNNESLQKVVYEGVFLATSENPVYENTAVIFIDADREDFEAAEEEKLSIGKYRLLEMSDNKIDKILIEEGRVSDLIKEIISDDLLKDKTIQIVDGEDLGRLKNIKKDINELKDTIHQIKDALDIDEYEEIEKLFDDIEYMADKLINEESEFEDMYQIIEDLNKIIESKRNEEEKKEKLDNKEWEDDKPESSNEEGNEQEVLTEENEEQEEEIDDSPEESDEEEEIDDFPEENDEDEEIEDSLEENDEEEEIDDSPEESDEQENEEIWDFPEENEASEDEVIEGNSEEEVLENGEPDDLHEENEKLDDESNDSNDENDELDDEESDDSEDADDE